MNEEDKFFAQLLSPNLHKLEEDLKKTGLNYEDFVAIIKNRLRKTRVGKPAIRKTLDVLWKLQEDVIIAKKVAEMSRDETQDL